MPWPVHPTGFLGARGDSDTYRIERSLRFNSADSAYLNRTPASAGNRQIWTISAWAKRSLLGSDASIYGTSESPSSGCNTSNLRFLSNDSLRFIQTNNVGASTIQLDTTQVFRDPSSWYHIILSVDTTQSTSSNRIKIYVNGSQVTSFSTSTYPAQNLDTFVNNNQAQYIGRTGSISPTSYFGGYLTEFYFIDGQALTPSSFGQTDPITGRWVAREYNGTYGTNGFYLKFADNSGTTATTLGKDSSGNGNNWTPNNFSVTSGFDNDSVIDVPSNCNENLISRGNYMTFNPLDLQNLGGSSTRNTLSNGNLKAITPTTGYAISWSTFPIFNTGKFKFEAKVELVAAGSGNQTIGFYAKSASNYSLYWSHTAGIYSEGGSTSATGYTTGDILTFEINRTSQTAVFYKNGTQILNTSFIPSITSDIFIVAFNGLTLNSGFSFNFGQQSFLYGDSSFRGLCTTNLAIPTINKPNKYMDALAYTGTGASNAISSLNFSPDLVWIKNRGTTTDHALYDIVRGAQAQLSSNTTGSEVTSSSGLTAFDSAGFTIGTSSLVNTSGTQYVAWSWDAGSTNSTNTSGSITSTVRANTQAGFSIVSYTGTNAASATIGHGLGTAPKMIIVKNRSQIVLWPTYHASLGNAIKLKLNLTDASAASGVWNSTSPTSTVFSVATGGSETLSNGDNYIAYCFAEIEGYSKFGSYTGNGSADGPFVWCGFRPRWVLVKRSDGVTNWHIFDTSRGTYNEITALPLYPNLSNAEGGTNEDIDIVCNGFKPRDASASFNINAATYIFAAFAETPFKYARAR